MVHALWVPDTGRLALIVHHLAVDGVSWRILLEDVKYRLGAASRRAGDRVVYRGTPFARWSAVLRSMRTAPGCLEAAGSGGRLCGPGGVVNGAPDRDTFATAGGPR